MRAYRNYPREQLHAGFRRFLRQNRKDVSGAAGAMLLAVALAVALNRNFIGGLVTGFALTFLASMVVTAYLTRGGGAALLYGALAEDLTREQLQSAVKQRLAWRVVDNIRLEGSDIDHVLISPGGVIAVETKYYGTNLRPNYVAEHARGAARSARRVQGLLTTVKSHRHDVHALLVLWGPNASGVQALAPIEGVSVVTGAHLVDALKRFGKGPLAEDHAQAVGDALDAYRKQLPAHR